MRQDRSSLSIKLATCGTVGPGHQGYSIAGEEVVDATGQVGLEGLRVE